MAPTSGSGEPAVSIGIPGLAASTPESIPPVRISRWRDDVEELRADAPELAQPILHYGPYLTHCKPPSAESFGIKVLVCNGGRLTSWQLEQAPGLDFESGPSRSVERQRPPHPPAGRWTRDSNQ